MSSSDRMKSPWKTMTKMLMICSIWLPTAYAAVVHVDSLDARAKVPFAKGVELRVLPIGDSITNGALGSADDAGYRSRLYKAMSTQWSNTFKFVGSIASGNFSQNHHEGHSGFIISSIQKSSQVGIYQSPNIALLHAGTNDMSKGVPADAPQNLINLIDDIFSKATNTTIFVCQIIPSANATKDAKIKTFNSQITSFVQPRYKGKKLVVVDMYTGFNKSNLFDGLHPSEAGYQDMANRFLKAITANEKMITKPGVARSPPK